ncbi:hypothetical protein QAD02_003278 [Eretmocerus hayati]|uniref:Uncharacterized protein n=1 Tax=Eretmocerus hayati TaxID=131215 RepID=A0ACC2NNX0_9HYME|nr:hypothetical protein QAD02_003278 [Eretmocerus hayati]
MPGDVIFLVFIPTADYENILSNGGNVVVQRGPTNLIRQHPHLNEFDDHYKPSAEDSDDKEPRDVAINRISNAVKQKSYSDKSSIPMETVSFLSQYSTYTEPC